MLSRNGWPIELRGVVAILFGLLMLLGAFQIIDGVVSAIQLRRVITGEGALSLGV